MTLHELVQDEARGRGVDLRLRRIPREVMDPRVVASGEVDFTYGTGELGADTFHNQWQSYRTRAQRKLELSAAHAHDAPGAHTVLVKVVDVFGNDTTTAVTVEVA